jgi:hypothetical protein
VLIYIANSDAAQTSIFPSSPKEDFISVNHFDSGWGGLELERPVLLASKTIVRSPLTDVPMRLDVEWRWI